MAKKKSKGNYPNVLHPADARIKKAKKAEKKKRKEDKGKEYEIRFDLTDADSFYQNRMVLPAAALWNFDEFLTEYLIAGINGLLNGVTDWDTVKDNAGRNARKQLIRARDLLIEQKRTQREIGHVKESYGDTALRIIADVGLGHLWD